MFSLILPTYNEAENLPELLPKIENVLQGIPHEVIIVDDDSPDGTWKVGQELAQDRDDVHVLRRIGRRGLSSAVIEGFLLGKGDVLAVMDADGQHDLSLLPKLYEAAKQSDIAIGSRYIEGGSVGDWDERRHMMSQMATKLALALCKVKAADPMSGFFAIKRDTFEEVHPRLNPKGFKILLDLLVHVPASTTVKEIPFTFGSRLHGESKLSRRVQLEFLEYLYDVTLGNYIPLTFVKFCIVGFLGVFVQLGAYMLLSLLFFGSYAAPDSSQFSYALMGAIEIAIIFNYLLNNVWTFGHMRLQGMSFLAGLVKFNIACAFGALANFAVATYLFALGWPPLVSVVVGSFVAAVWNYGMNRLFTWKA